MVQTVPGKYDRALTAATITTCARYNVMCLTDTMYGVTRGTTSSDVQEGVRVRDLPLPSYGPIPHMLRSTCFHERVKNSCIGEYVRMWDPREATNMGRVLRMMKRLRGAHTINAPPHRWCISSYRLRTGGGTAMIVYSHLIGRCNYSLRMCPISVCSSL